MGGEGNEYVFFTRSQSQESCQRLGRWSVRKGDICAVTTLGKTWRRRRVSSGRSTGGPVQGLVCAPGCLQHGGFHHVVWAAGE